MCKYLSKLSKISLTINKLMVWAAKKVFVFYIKIFERKFGSGYKRIKYMFVKNKSDKLVIVFSGFAAKKNRPVYNMVKTLRNINVNKLFILDDFGYEKRGSYYLGENGDFFISKLVSELINKIKAEQNIHEVYCIGSSKGGSAAIYFGLKHNVDFIIAGVPQYFIGNYLSTNETLLKSLYSIAGKTDQETIDSFNSIISQQIYEYNWDYKPRILLHYSENEHTYHEHIAFLLKDLKVNGFHVDEDIEEYKNHSDVSIYFPNLCKNKLKELTNEKKLNRNTAVLD